MTFKKYNHTNNAFCELMTDLGSSDTTMLLQGNFNRFPTENFIVKLSKVSGNSVVARENIYVANRNNNICTGLVRAYEKVPMNDDAAENIQQALNFSAGDMVEVVVSSEFLKDIQDRLENSVEKNRGLRTGFGQNKTILIDSNGDETIVNSTTGNPADTDMFRLQTQDGNEKKVPFSTIRNAVSGNEITLTAGENITGVAPIPVISIPQGNYTLNIMPSPVNGRFQN